MKRWQVVAVIVMVLFDLAMEVRRRRLHRDIRRELSAGRTLFEEPAVSTTVRSSRFLAWSFGWSSSDVCVTDRSAVLLGRILFITMPPVELLRSRVEAGTRPTVDHVIVSDVPTLENGRVVITGEGRSGARTTLKLKSARPEDLQRALESYLRPESSVPASAREAMIDKA